ncbi:MAG TPA: ABC transporter permease [Puia sp.]|jgi:ABC-type antimicrobial peptide transport system permease subunit|nr:ABC transporter permease [Puia sp.]
MKKKRTPRPPGWATWFLVAYCRPELLEDLQGDLNEFFERNLRKHNAIFAKAIYIIDVLKFFRPYTVRKPSFITAVKRNHMFGNYLKMSWRVMMRNKLFSGINIIGMAFSLSVGLLAIVFVSDLFSYDNDLQNKDRIFRVVSTFEPAGQPPVQLASTSWKSGILIRQNIPGIESITLLRNGFGGNVRIGENSIPVTGFYADQGFFDVLSFPLIEGAATTALKDPHSLVLTQSTGVRLFGNADPLGKVVKVDTVNYTVTGVLKDIPKLSHMRFEALASLSSIDPTGSGSDGAYMDWTNAFSNYVYVLLSKNSNPASFSASLDTLCRRQNAPYRNKIALSLQPLKNIAVGMPKGNEIGPAMPIAGVFIICGLALIIILSACFNYTNLSLARSLRRSREVGIRKVIGAQRIQVIGQFIAESLAISLLSLCFAFCIFLLLRMQFLSLHPYLNSMFSMELSPQLVVYFILLAILVGVVAGLLPALFYSKINAVQALKNASYFKVFRHISLRKALVVIQYTFSFIFITATIISYDQYKGFLHFDLGFSTDHIVNIAMQGNKDDVFTKELSAIPAVTGFSRSLIVSSLGSMTGSSVKYKDPTDSAGVDLNYIDENYLPLHKYTFLAGRNFAAKPKAAPESETIVNEKLVRRFNIGHNDPEKAIGETVTFAGKRLTIIGVLKDFHYGSLENGINPTAFRYLPQPGGYVNAKVSGPDLAATMAGIATAWKKLDKVHPLDAKLYDDQIEAAYSQFSVLSKVIGFFALLAIMISSLGLLGMVVYTMERRMKEISIRRVLGAGNAALMYLLSKSFLFLLCISALIALPLTWLFFEKVILSNFAYHPPIGFSDVFTGLIVVVGIACAMIGAQMLKIVRTNPATVLKNE